MTVEPKLDRIDRVCKKWFGYTTRPFQREVIEAVLEGKNTIGISGTGSGKSICFQLPALLAPKGSTVIVFSPLIALMKDMVRRCKDKGIRSARVSGDQTDEKNELIMMKASKGFYRLLFVAPERLKSKSFVEATERMKIALVAIDEVHCVSLHSANFRPDYMNIRKFARMHKGIPCLGVTATADKMIEVECARALGFKEYKRVIAPYERKDLEHICTRDLPEFKVNHVLRNMGEGSKLVYCSSRKSCEALALQLDRSGINAKAYHAGLDKDTRSEVQERFMAGKIDVMVATTAFGMGIDHPGIRGVLLWHVPGSIYDYVQQTGRASRDGKGAKCIMNISGEGRRLQSFFINIANPKLYVYQRMWEYFAKKIAVGEQLRTADDILAKVGGCPDAMSGWAMSALRFMEYNKAVSTLPGNKIYEFPIIRKVGALKLAEQFGGRLARGQLIIEVGPSDADPFGPIMRSGSVGTPKTRNELVIKKLCRSIPIDDEMISEKRSRDQRKFDDVLDFAAAIDKQKYLSMYFSQ